MTELAAAPDLTSRAEGPVSEPGGGLGTDTGPLLRCSPATVPIGLLKAAVGMAPIVALWWGAGARLHGWTHLVAAVAFWIYAVLRPIGVPLTWLTTRWRVDAEGVRLRSGWLDRQETSATWTEVVATDVSQPFLHRLFGCSSVRFALGTSRRGAIRIDAVGPRVRAEIEAVAARSATVSKDEAPVEPSDPEPSDPEPGDPESVDPRGHEIYRIRPRDYFVISVVYGQFVLLLPALWSAVDAVGDWVRLPLPGLTEIAARPGWQLGLAVVALVVLAVGYGWAFSWLRFRDFRVVRRDDLILSTGGLLTRAARQLPIDRVRGLRITQNPLMRLLGLGRVRVVTSDSGDQPMANLLFPLIRLSELSAVLGAELPLPAVATSGRRGPSSTPAGAVAVLVAATLLGSGLLVGAHALCPGHLAIGLTVALLAAALLTNALWVRLAVTAENDRIAISQGVLWVEHTEIDADAVHVLDCGQGLLGRLFGVSTLSLSYYDGRIRRARSLGCDADRRRELRALVRG